MTTTTERLLQLAAEHEQKAQALRLAAAELNGHRTERKQAKVVETFDQAIQLRKQQRPQAPTERTSGEDTKKRARLLRLFILHEPHTSNEISAYLTKNGYPIGRHRVRQLVAMMPEVQKIGTTKKTKWVMASRLHKGESTKRERQRSVGLKKARIVATILKELGDMPIRDLSKAARKEGVPSLTGIHNYVKQGYISRNGGKKGHYRYSFKAMPPETADAAAAS